MSRDKDYIRLIHKSRWLQLRKAKLTACPVCERCADEGRTRAATEVHHVTPVERGLTAQEKERLMYDPHNLRALCHECHVLTHTEMGRGGKANARAHAKAQMLKFVKKYGLA